MISEDSDANAATAIVSRQEVEVVVRSPVEPNRPYAEYRNVLRFDFFHSCAYCTITEDEARGIRFTIDHYEPQSTRPDLKNDYSNLMWCCGRCNELKSDFSPPNVARTDGNRYFRPDTDRFSDHFMLGDLLLQHLSRTGWFTIEVLDLNRQVLQKIRSMRKRIYECDIAVAEGLKALRSFGIDQLPKHIRASAVKVIEQVQDKHVGAIGLIDHILRDHMRSPLLDDDFDAKARLGERAKKMSGLKSMYAGDWRSSRK